MKRTPKPKPELFLLYIRRKLLRALQDARDSSRTSPELHVMATNWWAMVDRGLKSRRLLSSDSDPQSARVDVLIMATNCYVFLSHVVAQAGDFGAIVFADADPEVSWQKVQ